MGGALLARVPPGPRLHAPRALPLPLPLPRRPLPAPPTAGPRCSPLTVPAPSSRFLPYTEGCFLHSVAVFKEHLKQPVGISGLSAVCEDPRILRRIGSHCLSRGRGTAWPSRRFDSEAVRQRSSPVAAMDARPWPPPQRPVLLLDVMGTLVRDPFHEDIPQFFGLTMPELLRQKHPTAWVEFETGHLTEAELIAKFFADGREFDCHGLKQCMTDGYRYLDGIEDLLTRLSSRGYSLHAFTNYPCWYQMIEDKLNLSQYLPWTFVSCHVGKRKPDKAIYVEAAQHLNVQPEDCIFVDDRPVNVEAACAIGMKGVIFQDACQLERDLRAHGVEI